MTFPALGWWASLRRTIRLPLPAGVRDAIANEQLRLIWLHAEQAMLIASGFAVLMAWRLHDEVPAGWAATWLALKLGVAAVRLGYARLFGRQLQQGLQTSPWEQRTWLLLALDGAAWGLAGAALVGGSVSVAALSSAILACVACVATFGLQGSFNATAAYVAPILLPTAAMLFLRGDDAGVLGGFGLGLLLTVVLSTAAKAQRRVAEQVIVGLKAQDLAREKGDALRLALHQSAVKSQFLGSVSHELRTPLHGILGLSRLMHLESQDDLVRQRVELVEASARHLLDLINDLLDMARIESGQFNLRREPVELGLLFEQVIGIYEVRAQDKGLRLVADLALPRPCWVSLDAARLRQVLHNLLGNAIKFTRQGEVRVRVRISPAEALWRVEVEDTGLGVSRQDAERIFGAFEQAATAQAHPNEGAGLGLKIAREIALAMGGDLTLSSQPGVGSCFCFTARFDPVAAPADCNPLGRTPMGSSLVSGGFAALAGGPQGAASVPRWRHAPTVLLAEDDEVNAMIASAYLLRAGAVVERVPNGKEAVRRALRETQRPDLLLMDCRMPEMDGYEATRAIRAQESTLGLARLPVVALTATVTEFGRAECLEAGMDDFLAKPFSQDELERLLHAHLAA